MEKAFPFTLWVLYLPTWSFCRFCEVLIPYAKWIKSLVIHHPHSLPSLPCQEVGVGMLKGTAFQSCLGLSCAQFPFWSHPSSPSHQFSQLHTETFISVDFENFKETSWKTKHALHNIIKLKWFDATPFWKTWKFTFGSGSLTCSISFSLHLLCCINQEIYTYNVKVLIVFSVIYFNCIFTIIKYTNLVVSAIYWLKWFPT